MANPAPHPGSKRRPTLTSTTIDRRAVYPSSLEDSPINSAPSDAHFMTRAPPHPHHSYTQPTSYPPFNDPRHTYQLGQSAHHKPQFHESRCLSELAVNLFVAFEDDRHTFDTSAHPGVSRSEELTTHYGQGFTHVIAIRYEAPPSKYTSPSSTGSSVRYLLDQKTGVHTLMLVIPYEEQPVDDLGYPSSSAYQASDDGQDDVDLGGGLGAEGNTLLTVPQLLALRHFIASTGYTLRCPPDFHSGSPYAVPASVARNVRVLITVPRDRRTDAICAAASFVAWDLEFQVDDVLESVSEDDEVMPVWRNVVGSEAARLLEKALVV